MGWPCAVCGTLNSAAGGSCIVCGSSAPLASPVPTPIATAPQPSPHVTQPAVEWANDESIEAGGEVSPFEVEPDGGQSIGPRRDPGPWYRSSRGGTIVAVGIVALGLFTMTWIDARWGSDDVPNREPVAIAGEPDEVTSPRTAGDGVSSTDGATVPAPTVGRPVVTGPLTLTGDGVGPYRFGDDAESVVAGLSGELGPPSNDAGWGPVYQDDCVQRLVSWYELSLTFVAPGSSSDPSGSGTFRAWSVAGDGPSSFSDERGVGVGSSYAEVRAAHPEATETSSSDEILAEGGDGFIELFADGIRWFWLEGNPTTMGAGDVSC